jgi:hypothetical protein
VIFTIAIGFTTPKSAQALCKDSITFSEPIPLSVMLHRSPSSSGSMEVDHLSARSEKVERV